MTAAVTTDRRVARRFLDPRQGYLPPTYFYFDVRYLPREVDPLVYNMSHEDPGDVSYSNIGGLGEQIRELREVIELPLLNPELFQRVGIVPPKGCLLYGPPGTGKTLLARAVASQLDANFLKVVSSAIVDKYIGELNFFKSNI